MFEECLLLFIPSSPDHELQVICRRVYVLRPAKLIQSLGGVVWLASSLNDNQARSLAHTPYNQVQHKQYAILHVPSKIHGCDSLQSIL